MASAAAPKRVVIVESPTKATTIARFLDDTYTVESSRGHVRDLPTKASEIPKTFRSEPWARLGIDVENDFKPLYVLNSGKRDTVSSLKKLVATADELYLATDEDREGEAIAWHLLEVLSPPQRVTIRRLVFHEITPDAIRAALANPREIDRRLVDAQEARRLLDRLYGYEVSPVLWKKVAPACPPGACRAWRRASSSSASGSGWRSFPRATGRCSSPLPLAPTSTSGWPSPPSTVHGSPAAGTSVPTGSRAAPVSSSSTGTGPNSSPRSWRAGQPR